MPTASLVLVMIAALLSQRSASPAAPASLDFEFFKTQVQPIFLAKRPGHARCYVCHHTRPSLPYPILFEPLSPGSSTWNDEQSRKNFERIRRVVVPGQPLQSRLLQHPLAVQAGGDFFHSGGKHWNSQNDPEWRTLAAWVRGQTSTTSAR